MRRQGTALCPAGEKERNSRRHHVVIPKNGDGESVPAAVGGEASGHWVGVLDRLMDRPSQTHQPSPMSHRGRHGPRSARLSPGPGSGEHTRPEGWGGGGHGEKTPRPRETDTSLPDACHRRAPSHAATASIPAQCPGQPRPHPGPGWATPRIPPRGAPTRVNNAISAI